MSWYNPEHYGCTRFHGDVLQLLAQFRCLNDESFALLQNVMGSSACYRDITIFSATAFHYDTKVINSENYYRSEEMLRRLLQTGASPDPAGYRVTPLQLACFKRSLYGVRALLEAGADPNYVGDPDGIGWDDETEILHPFSKLHGTSPIDILDRYGPIFDWEDEMHGIEKELMKEFAETIVTEIRRVLLSYMCGDRPALQYGRIHEGGSDEEYMHVG